MEFCERIREEIKNKGFAVVPFEKGPFTQSDLDALKSELDPRKVPYVLSIEGNTEEETFVNYYRILHDKDPTILDQDVLNILGKNHVKNFFKKSLNLDDYKIERCQSHVYGLGGFHGKHIDSDYNDQWSYTALLVLKEADSGGEFVLYEKDKKNILSPKSGELLVFGIDLPHEVLPVNSGTRHVLIFFIKSL